MELTGSDGNMACGTEEEEDLAWAKPGTRVSEESATFLTPFQPTKRHGQNGPQPVWESNTSWERASLWGKGGPQPSHTELCESCPPANDLLQLLIKPIFAE